MRHLTSEHGEEPCKKFALNMCHFGERCLFKHTNLPVQNVVNSPQEQRIEQTPQIFLNTPTSDQHLMVGQQQEQVM